MGDWNEDSQGLDEIEGEPEDSCDGEVYLDGEPAWAALAEQEFIRWLSRRRANRMITTKEDSIIHGKPEPGKGTG